ncbi:hypothetical protein CYMTET_49134 [Cymbomonas tetramitiformis]|uniref:Uncharacterized protein n=1 Tax=Cymbomonas tetramitiformis TaxID=36881 RepID=A0AAE0EU61_9CHLO|nr:hypothetical protein CYMTET_49134 [Cymbomonas tetramitiformis]
MHAAPASFLHAHPAAASTSIRESPSPDYGPTSPEYSSEFGTAEYLARRLSERLLHLQKELVIGKNTDINLAGWKYVPRSSVTVCGTVSEAEDKLTQLGSEACKTILAGSKCFLCQGYWGMCLICANGHTICDFCKAEPISATLKHCGVCHEPRLQCQIRLPAVFEDMYANLRDQSCPLCTDDNARSVKELLQHMHRCPASFWLDLETVADVEDATIRMDELDGGRSFSVAWNTGVDRMRTFAIRVAATGEIVVVVTGSPGKTTSDAFECSGMLFLSRRS